MSELLSRLTGAIRFIAEGDAANAVATLRHCAGLDPSQCDVWITWAAAQTGPVSDDLLAKIVSTRGTLFACFSQIDDEYTRVVHDRSPHYSMQFASLRAPLTSRSGIDVAHTVSLALAGRYDEADEMIVRLPDTEARLVRAWLMNRTGRYTDALVEAAALGAFGREDALTYGRLFSGIAHAHLGNFGAARDQLLDILPTETSLVDALAAAEAAYWVALTWREEDDQQAASQFLQRALAISPQPRFQQALGDPAIRIRLTRAELIDRRSDRWDIATEPTLAEAQSQEMATKRGGLLEEGLQELDSLIGMAQLKADIKTHCHYIRGLQRRQAAGLRAERASTHLIFAGPPGTGKTTVAKVVAKIYAGLGITATDNLVVASKADFVAGFLGQTSTKSKETLNRALDGVLFIDEAYQLVSDTGNSGTKDSFGSEAATEIVAFMEEYRDRIVVIIAGYSDDIDRLLETNEGWASRFTTRFDFRSYNIDELVDMAQSWCKTEEYILPDESVEFLRSKARALYADHGASGRQVIDRLGNGRFVRKLMEAAAKYALANAMSNALGDDVGTDSLQVLSPDVVERAFDELSRRELGGKVA